MLKKKRGRIEIVDGWLEEMDIDVLVALFGDFYPQWIDYEYAGTKTYYGMSEHFREIEDGDDIPLYEATVVLGDQMNFIEFKEVEEARQI